ncbi:MAG: MMPL family transporter [Gammaproteobacteria bacterium]|nr:MMPL family transporter [Gammaproteobacteria bacterium]
MPDFHLWLDRILYRWIGLSIRLRYMILPVLLAVAVLALFYTFNNIRVNTDTRGMLSQDLPWRQLDLAYEKAFPMYVDNILVMVEAGTPDQAADAAAYLAEKLRQQDDQYREVLYVRGLDFLRRSSLLYLDIDELRDLSDDLASIQPFLGRLVGDQSLRGLLALIEDAVEARRAGDHVELAPMLEQTSAVTRETATGEVAYLSWQDLISGETEQRDVYREFIVIQPRLDYTSLLPGEAAIGSVRDTVRSTDLQDRFAAGVRLTGGAALDYEELQSVGQGAGIAALLALIIVAVILVLGLKSARLVIAALITLITGLILTAAMATVTVGELNLISVAFAVLYIGLGVDFAIHFCLRFRELHGTMDTADALTRTGTSIGHSLFLCALTTAIGLYAFIPTDYRGIAELGWISGTGMFISLFVTLTLLPTLLASIAPHHEQPLFTGHHPWLEKLATVPNRHARSIVIIAVLLALAAAALLPAVRFDSKTLNLQSPDTESVQAYRDLLADGSTSPLNGIVMKKNAGGARQLAESLEALPEVESVQTIADFIPDNQDAKLDVIDEMNFLLGATLARADNTSVSATERHEAFNNMLAYLESNPPRAGETALQDFHAALRAFGAELEKRPRQADTMLKILERHLLQNLPGRLAMLRNALNAQPVAQADIPDTLLHRWLSPDGWYLLEIQPHEKLVNEASMRRFVDAVRTETDDLIGAPVIQLEAGDAVVTAFEEAFFLAFSVITLLLLILLRSVYDTLLAIAPIALAALLTAAGTVVLDIPFNFANIIALPLLLGIGIDNSIHILHRYHSAPPDSGLLLQTSTSRAILVSALTTICSIGNLAFSAHQGTASMGLLLTIGISISLICALVLMPSLLSLRRDRQN